MKNLSFSRLLTKKHKTSIYLNKPECRENIMVSFTSTTGICILYEKINLNRSIFTKVNINE